MIVVEMRLVSARGSRYDRVLGRAVISNTGEGSKTKGDYTAVFRGGLGGKGKSGVVTDYPRIAVSPWNLLRRALEAAGYNK